MLGLGKLASKERCPYGFPPSIEIISETDWTIDGVSRKNADHSLCQAIIANSKACDGCPLYVERKEPSDFLQRVIELDELIGAGYRPELPFVEWKGIALLKRKRNEKEIQDMKKKS